MSDSRSPRPWLEGSEADPLTRRLLRAGRSDHFDSERATSSVAAAIAAARSAGATGASTPKGDDLQRRALWTKAVFALVPVIGISVATYSLTTTAPPQTSPSTIESPPPPKSSPVLPPSTGSAEPVPSVTGPMALPDAKARPAAAQPGASERPPPSPRVAAIADGTFEVELALLRQVTAARSDNHPAPALALIDEHDRRFSNGVLVPEFAGERVLTLAALGRHDEACAHAAEFLAKYPKSPFVPEVRSLCADPTKSR